MKDKVSIYPSSYKTEYFKGDDFNAFGQHGIVIYRGTIPESITISKLELRVGKCIITYENPEFPLYWDPDAETTEKLDYSNDCYCAIYDEHGKKRTCDGTFKFIVRDKKV